MNILATLKDAGGSQGGIFIYAQAKTAAQIANVQRKRRKLWKNTKKLMKQYFPKLDLDAVRFCIHASLPGNWFQTAGNVEGMTFGYTIYFKNTDYQKTRQGLKYLMHELVHVEQCRRKGGEVPFASDYGKGYVKAGNYRDNPMEKEAYDLVAAHGNELPNGVKK